jgi:hypothetical protein
MFLDELRTSLQEAMGITLGESTIYRHLRAAGLTMKIVSFTCVTEDYAYFNDRSQRRLVNVMLQNELNILKELHSIILMSVYMLTNHVSIVEM